MSTSDTSTEVTMLRGAPLRRAGRYVVGELLGRGGMAEVFAGRAIGSHGFQKPVAIKRLLPELASDDVFVARLIAEAKLLVGMQHGNLVSVIDLAREGDDVFLVMEFVDGPSLRELLKLRARALSIGVATYVVQSAAAGIELAHSRGVIHADISPTNILLTTSGEVRVADFGIARKVGGGHGMVEGKWAYMSPEQARGAALTPASDVFSLGIVLYELLAGQHPFGRRNTQAAALRELRPDVPAELEAVCLRALATDARARYARMQDLIDALSEVRFACGLREGASELAAAIRKASESKASRDRGDVSGTRSIVASSLLQKMPDGTPARGIETPVAGVRVVGSAQALTVVSATLPMTEPPTLGDETIVSPTIPPSDPQAQTVVSTALQSMIVTATGAYATHAAHAAAELAMAALAALPPAPAPPRKSQPAILDVASSEPIVTTTATHTIAPPMRRSLVEFNAVMAGEPPPPPVLPVPARTLRLALIVLAIATLIGAIAAIASRSGPPPAQPPPPFSSPS